MAAHYRILLNDDGVDRLGGRDFTFVAFAGNVTHCCARGPSKDVSGELDTQTRN